MTIRWQRDGLRLKRVATVAALTELHRQAADVEGEARDFKHRVQALKEGLLEDHARRVVLTRQATAQERAQAPRVAGNDVLRARQRVGLSQRELALALLMPRGSLADMERGRRKPTPRVARWAAGVLRPAGEEVEAPASDQPFALADPAWERDAAPVRGLAPFPKGAKR